VIWCIKQNVGDMQSELQGFNSPCSTRSSSSLLTAKRNATVRAAGACTSDVHDNVHHDGLTYLFNARCLTFSLFAHLLRMPDEAQSILLEQLSKPNLKAANIEICIWCSIVMQTVFLDYVNACTATTRLGAKRCSVERCGLSKLR
jgi:hypothetical protein